MNKSDIIDLDQQVKLAYEELVKLNKQYNDLLTNNYREQNNKNQNIINPEEVSLKHKKNIINIIYWLLLTVIFICKGSGLLSLKLYTILFFSNLGLNIFLLYKVDKKKKTLIDSKYEDNQTIDKDELYELLCESREKYHSLRKKREEFTGLEELITYIEEKEISYNDNSLKKLSLDK